MTERECETCDTPFFPQRPHWRHCTACWWRHRRPVRHAGCGCGGELPEPATSTSCDNDHMTHDTTSNSGFSYRWRPLDPNLDKEGMMPDSTDSQRRSRRVRNGEDPVRIPDALIEAMAPPPDQSDEPLIELTPEEAALWLSDVL